MIACDHCTGLCCRFIIFTLDKPETEEDYLDIFWYIFHKPVLVYIDHDGDWCVKVPVGCKHVLPDGKCGIYENRPPVCRAYKVEACERNWPDIVTAFHTERDYADWLVKNNIMDKDKIPEVYLQ